MKVSTTINLIFSMENLVRNLIMLVEAGRKNFTNKKGKVVSLEGLKVKTFKNQAGEIEKGLTFDAKITKMPNEAKLVNSKGTKYCLVDIEHNVELFKTTITSSRIYENSMKNWKSGDEISVRVSEYLTDGKFFNSEVGFSSTRNAINEDDFSSDEFPSEIENMKAIAIEMGE